MKRIPQTTISKITEKINGLFEKLKARFLGPKFGKAFRVEYKRHLSLPGIYATAVADESGVPDKQILNQIVDTSSNYIDALKLKTINKVVDNVQSFVSEASINPVSEEDVFRVLKPKLVEAFASVSSDLKRIVETESQKSNALGAYDGIVKTNASVGIEDPSVFFVTVRDGSRCEECTKLHLLEDGTTPRVWKMSEVSQGLHKRGDPQPSVSGLHPNCACRISSIFPGFGFNKSGMVTWIKEGHNEYAKQRGTVEKHEHNVFEILKKQV